MTILFCDMQGFTSFSEGMTSAGFVKAMNRYLTVLSEPVRRNSGIIDKYIMTQEWRFGARPLPRPTIRRGSPASPRSSNLLAVPRFRRNCRTSPASGAGFQLHTKLRIGVATGEVVVGNIGSSRPAPPVVGDVAEHRLAA